MAHDVFLSHSSKDKAIADAAVACIESRKIRCWVAPRDIVAGSDWSESIIDGINGASVMVLILSENSNVSKQVLREIERAANRGIPILPFRVADIELSKSLEYFLSSAHWLDAYQGKVKDNIEILANNVANVLERQDAIVDVKTPSVSPRRNPFPLIGVAITIMLVVLASVFFFNQSHNKKTAIKNALQQGDHATALSLDPTNRQALALKQKSEFDTLLEAGDFEAVLAIDPDNKEALALKSESIEYKAGIGGQNILKMVAEKLGAPNGGLGVTDVSEEQKCGIQLGDVIVKFNGKQITNVTDILAAGWNEVQPDTEYPITVVRNGKPIEMTLTPFARLKKKKPEDGNLFLVFGQLDQFKMAKREIFLNQLVVSGGIAMALDYEGLASYWELYEDDPGLNTIKDREFSALGGAVNGNRFVLANARNGELLVWSPAAKSLEGIMEGHPNDKVIAVLLSDDGTKAVSIAKKGGVRTWDLATRKMLKEMTLQEIAKGKLWWAGDIGMFAENFSISTSGRYLGQHSARSFVIFDLEKEGLQQKIETTETLKGSALSPDGSLVALGFENGRIEIRNTVTNEVIHTLRWHTGEASLVAFLSPNILLSSSSDQRDSQLIVWDLKTESPNWGYQFVEDNNMFAFGPKHVRYDRGTQALYAGTATVRKLGVPDDLVSSLEKFSWAGDNLPEPTGMSVADTGDPASPDFSATSTMTTTAGDGSKTEIASFADGTSVVTSRDAKGQLTRKLFRPADGDVGLGVYFKLADGELLRDKIPQGLTVEEIAHGGQAERDGVLNVGDVIVSLVDDADTAKPIKGLYFADVARQIFGDEGTTLRVGILRGGSQKPMIVTLKRGRILAVRNPPVKSDWKNNLGMDFVFVPMGIGKIGIESSVHVDSRSQYVRHTKSFLIGIHEVTQSEFEKVMGRNPSAHCSGGERGIEVKGVDTSFHPVDSVTWEDANEFCKKLSRRDGVNYRLPTEAEWEWACRNAGTESWSIYDQSSEFEEMAVGTSDRKTLASGSRSPNEAGIFDMYGNVAEWCLDWNDKAGREAVQYVDPSGPTEGVKKVVRGGSYQNFGRQFRDRSSLNPSEKRPYLGFRVILDASNKEQKALKEFFERDQPVQLDMSSIPKVLPVPGYIKRSEADEKKIYDEVNARFQSGDSGLNDEFLELMSANQRFFSDARRLWPELSGANEDRIEAFLAYNDGHRARQIGKANQTLPKLEAARKKDLLMGWVSNDIAWSLATNSNENHRDGIIAVQRAIEACETVRWRYWGFLDTLAAALAEVGEFAEAKRVATAARQMAPTSEHAYLDRLIGLYGEGKPYSD
ncbi:SUMF1/EgtB/PvdO family nonheme iron enzyme [bacterium]|nr:SUMF1/EgtB/PvdO family nonheme iron enzyme [bacterium]